MAFIKEGTR